MSSYLFSPDYSQVTGLLQHLNDDELKELLENEDKLKTLISDNRQVQDIESERELLMASNKSISEYNLSKRPELNEQRKQVEETRKIAVELKEILMEKKRKIEGFRDTTPKDTLLALLQAATSETESEAEACVDTFLSQELSVEEFIPKYLELRKLAHLRRIKSEKFQHLLSGSSRASNIDYPIRPQRTKKSLDDVHSSTSPIVPVRQAPLPPTANQSHQPYSAYPNNNAPYQPYSIPSVAPQCYFEPNAMMPPLPSNAISSSYSFPYQGNPAYPAFNRMTYQDQQRKLPARR